MYSSLMNAVYIVSGEQRIHDAMGRFHIAIFNILRHTLSSGRLIKHHYEADHIASSRKFV